MENQQQAGAYYVDVVLCIDATGSMSPIITEVKNNAMSLCDKFHEAMEENNKEVTELRVKVIAFRDFEDAEPIKESEFFVLPDQNAAFQAFVNGIEAIGGGDIPENALEAIAVAMKSDWTTKGGKKRRHAIMLFSDAPALPLGTRSGSANYPAGMPADLTQLGAWWEGTDQSFSGTYSPNAGRLVAFVPNAEPWTDIQAWNRYWPAFSPAGTGLEDLDIQSAIDLMVGSF